VHNTEIEKEKDVRDSDMEKVRFAFADGNGEDEFFVLEETKINGSAYILVTESEDDDAECLILKDVQDEATGESVYEIVEDDRELQAVSKVFEELLEDVSIEL
jgi:hypothetical protein